MAEPRIRADQHAHVEAENRLHCEAWRVEAVIILSQAVSTSQYLIQRFAALDWLPVEIYQPYIVTVQVPRGRLRRGCQ